MTDIIYRLKSDSYDLWSQIQRNEFVESLATGRLPVEGLREYVKQDYVYTIGFTRSLALIASRSNSEVDLRHFVGMARFGADVDLPMHKTFAKSMGVSQRELEQTEPNSTTVGYNNYLRGIANKGAIVGFAVACLPCIWSYGLLAKRILSGLRVHYHVKGHGLDLWNAYNSATYKGSIRKLKNIIRTKSRGAHTEEYLRLTSNFRRSCRYELDFWNIHLYRDDCIM